MEAWLDPSLGWTWVAIFLTVCWACWDPSSSFQTLTPLLRLSPNYPPLTLQHLWISSITFLFSNTPENSGCDSFLVLSFFSHVLSPSRNLQLLTTYNSLMILSWTPGRHWAEACAHGSLTYSEAVLTGATPDPLLLATNFKLPADRTAQPNPCHWHGIRLHALDVNQLAPTSTWLFVAFWQKDAWERECWHLGVLQMALNTTCSKRTWKLMDSVYPCAFLSIALPANGFWWIPMSSLLVPGRPFYLCLPLRYHTSSAVLTGHHVPHGEVRVSTRACRGTAGTPGPGGLPGHVLSAPVGKRGGPSGARRRNFACRVRKHVLGLWLFVPLPKPGMSGHRAHCLWARNPQWGLSEPGEEPQVRIVHARWRTPGEGCPSQVKNPKWGLSEPDEEPPVRAALFWKGEQRGPSPGSGAQGWGSAPCRLARWLWSNEGWGAGATSRVPGPRPRSGTDGAPGPAPLRSPPWEASGVLTASVALWQRRAGSPGALQRWGGLHPSTCCRPGPTWDALWTLFPNKLNLSMKSRLQGWREIWAHRTGIPASSLSPRFCKGPWISQC